MKNKNQRWFILYGCICQTLEGEYEVGDYGYESTYIPTYEMLQNNLKELTSEQIEQLFIMAEADSTITDNEKHGKALRIIEMAKKGKKFRSILEHIKDQRFVFDVALLAMNIQLPNFYSRNIYS
jgi:spore coat protein CotF